MEYKYQAIILNKNDVGETDRIYVVYTKEAGKMRLLAKGVKKPNAKLAGILESVSFCEIFFAKTTGNGKITGAISVDNFSCIKGDISAIERIFSVFRIFDQLITQEEKDEEIFLFLLDYLKAMEEASIEKKEKEKMDILASGFIFKLFHNLGYGLEVKKCVLCFQKLELGRNYFSAEKGGIICQNCAPKEIRKIKISDEAIKLIRIFLENKIKNLIKIKTDKKIINDLKIITSEVVRWIVG